MSAILSAKPAASDKGGSVSIPFFDNLPIAAIPAVQRLYDEVTSPGWNALTAYANFVSRLNSARTDVPPRSVVKRWIAGVHANLIHRPVLPDALPEAPVQEKGYFEALPDSAMPSLSELWDEVQASTGSNDEEAEDEKTFDAFFDAMRAIGHREPQWRQFVSYAKAIRAGQVERPARQIERLDTSSTEEVKPEAPSVQEITADILVSHPETVRPVRPNIAIEQDEESGLLLGVSVSVDAARFEATRQKIIDALAAAPLIPTRVNPTVEERPAPAIMAVKTAAGRLLEENIIQLSREIEQTARQNTARMLRKMADELEHAVGSGVTGDLAT